MSLIDALDDPKPEPWTVDSLMAAMSDGRDFKAVKQGHKSYIFGSDASLDNEVMAAHALNPANGWQIEEIV